MLAAIGGPAAPPSAPRHSSAPGQGRPVAPSIPPSLNTPTSDSQPTQPAGYGGQDGAGAGGYPGGGPAWGPRQTSAPPGQPSLTLRTPSSPAVGSQGGLVPSSRMSGARVSDVGGSQSAWGPMQPMQQPQGGWSQQPMQQQQGWVPAAGPQGGPQPDGGWGATNSYPSAAGVQSAQAAVPQHQQWVQGPGTGAQQQQYPMQQPMQQHTQPVQPMQQPMQQTWVQASGLALQPGGQGVAPLYSFQADSPSPYPHIPGALQSQPMQPMQQPMQQTMQQQGYDSPPMQQHNQQPMQPMQQHGYNSQPMQQQQGHDYSLSTQPQAPPSGYFPGFGSTMGGSPAPYPGGVFPMHPGSVSLMRGRISGSSGSSTGNSMQVQGSGLGQAANAVQQQPQPSPHGYIQQQQQQPAPSSHSYAMQQPNPSFTQQQEPSPPKILQQQQMHPSCCYPSSAAHPPMQQQQQQMHYPSSANGQAPAPVHQQMHAPSAAPAFLQQQMHYAPSPAPVPVQQQMYAPNVAPASVQQPQAVKQMGGGRQDSAGEGVIKAVGSMALLLG